MKLSRKIKAYIPGAIQNQDSSVVCVVQMMVWVSSTSLFNFKAALATQPRYINRAMSNIQWQQQIKIEEKQ